MGLIAQVLYFVNCFQTFELEETSGIFDTLQSGSAQIFNLWRLLANEIKLRAVVKQC